MPGAMAAVPQPAQELVAGSSMLWTDVVDPPAVRGAAPGVGELLVEFSKEGRLAAVVGADEQGHPVLWRRQFQASVEHDLRDGEGDRHVAPRHGAHVASAATLVIRKGIDRPLSPLDFPLAQREVVVVQPGVVVASCVVGCGRCGGVGGWCGGSGCGGGAWLWGSLVGVVVGRCGGAFGEGRCGRLGLRALSRRAGVVERGGWAMAVEGGRRRERKTGGTTFGAGGRGL